jgi:hypothetical protein
METNKVIIESPYSGNIKENVQYALECLHDSYYNHKEAPFASHLLYTRFPQSKIENGNYHGHVEDSSDSRLGREHGINCGFEWGKCADLVVVYVDLGISTGMKYGIENAKKNNIPVIYRSLKNLNKLKELSLLLYKNDNNLKELKDKLIDINQITNIDIENNLLKLNFEEFNNFEKKENKLKIAVSGKICSGKTTFTNILKEEISNIYRISVASRLKWLAINLFGMSPNPDKKNRLLLQELGVKLREQCADVWINSFFDDCQKYTNVMCDDIRFKNELQKVKDNNFITIRLNISEKTQKERIVKCYPDNYEQHLKNTQHISETDLDDSDDFNYIINSEDYTTEDLRKFIQQNIN